MFPEFAYIMKVNIGIIVLYFTYKLLFSKDTFFKLRRSILLIFLAVALLYPLINIQGWMSQQTDIKKVVLIYTTIVPGSIIAPHTAVTDWHAILLSGIKYLYWIVAGALLIRFSIQLFCILNLARASRKGKVHDVDVRIMQKPNGPFSFFGLIFIHPDSINENELDEVLTHECTHASQWHSLDVIIYELACTAFWFNPFIWLLKHEVRYNLEYLADEHVLKAGYDCKSYQYHLLGMTQQNLHDSIVLSNRFNILPIKSRIRMMNKRRTHQLFKAKYLIAIPLAGCLLLISNIDALARIKDEIVDNKLTRIIMPAINKAIENDAAQTDETDDNVYVSVEKMPEFPGGQVELLKFMARNTKYPEKAIEKGIEGKVICSFVVEKDGSLANPTILKGVDPTLDHEAMRVISTMPKWTPGEQNGKAVSVKYTVPIIFRLPKENKDAQAEPKPAVGNTSNEPIFTIVEEMPQFPGGTEALLQYLSKKIKYPTDAVEHGIQGRVTCGFVVERDGTLNDIQILRGVDPSLDAEAVRVIQSMPKWIPGKQRSVPVPVKYSVPVTFRLQ
jgi:TonB family protein